MNSEKINDLKNNLTRKLLSLRTDQGFFEGCLSSSALSTATSVFALAMVNREKYQKYIYLGLNWLKDNQNTDGGWGDTIKSRSNISTTLLVWSAFSIAEGRDFYEHVVNNAQRWLRTSAGSLDPLNIIQALDKKYGNDKTFSVPILTMAAIAGRLGETENIWKWIKPLPFEFSVLPHFVYKWLRLNVVSYALPALITMGQVHYYHKKPMNPLIRIFRSITKNKALKKLGEIQPENGGFLEAAPLTGFVVMTLADMGFKNSPVVRKGIDFLLKSIREDGSWPIDTNLNTWVTTLSVNSLSVSESPRDFFSAEEISKLTNWITSQQFTCTHPYTKAAPGGWGWTNLPGSVPDADDTPGALIAIWNLAKDKKNIRACAGKGIKWLINIQNSDGGIPTFCRGWGKLDFDKSAPDLTAHTVAAFSLWIDSLQGSFQNKAGLALEKALYFLEKNQEINGSWIPLWFGNESNHNQANPVYGTSRVISYLSELPEDILPHCGPMLVNACRWIMSIQNEDGGWGSDKSIDSSIEETAVALDAVSSLLAVNDVLGKQIDTHQIINAVNMALKWLVDNTKTGTRLEPGPIGLYFARLWYFESAYPIIFSLSAVSKAQKALENVAQNQKKVP